MCVIFKVTYNLVFPVPVALHYAASCQALRKQLHYDDSPIRFTQYRDFLPWSTNDYRIGLYNRTFLIRQPSAVKHLSAATKHYFCI